VGTGFPSGFATENEMSHVIHCETIPARAPWSRVIRAGEALRIIDIHGQQAVDFLATTRLTRLSAITRPTR
jgi:uncharacterized protein YcgI (DUF1989 family)